MPEWLKLYFGLGCQRHSDALRNCVIIHETRTSLASSSCAAIKMWNMYMCPGSVDLGNKKSNDRYCRAILL